MSYAPSFPGVNPQAGYPGAPAGGHTAPHGVNVTDTTGAFEGGQFRIDHRDSNSLLAIMLQQGVEIKGKPGSMVAMDASVRIQGKMKFSFKKLVTGGEMSESIFTGPGEVLLAPEVWGDIVPIRVDGSVPWSVGKDAFLASTRDIVRTTKSQGLGKALFSGEGLFVAQVTGNGLMFVQSMGAIMRRDLAQGEQWIVDNGHLVAWTARYEIERIKAGGLLSGAHTGEGLVCRFTGPGTVYLQTRNPEALGAWIAEQMPSSSS